MQIPRGQCLSRTLPLGWSTDPFPYPPHARTEPISPYQVVLVLVLVLTIAVVVGITVVARVSSSALALLRGSVRTQVTHIDWGLSSSFGARHRGSTYLACYPLLSISHTDPLPHPPTHIPKGLGLSHVPVLIPRTTQATFLVSLDTRHSPLHTSDQHLLSLPSSLPLLALSTYRCHTRATTTTRLSLRRQNNDIIINSHAATTQPNSITLLHQLHRRAQH